MLRIFKTVIVLMIPKICFLGAETIISNFECWDHPYIKSSRLRGPPTFFFTYYEASQGRGALLSALRLITAGVMT